MAKAAIQSTILSTQNGVSVAGGATVTIKDSETGAAVSLWTDRAGATGETNPFNADSDGHFLVYANSGVVDVDIVNGAETQTIKHLSVVDVPLQQINDVDGLRSISPTDGRVIYVKAHTSQGDGGHGEFEGLTGASAGTYADDDGVTILPTGGDGSSCWRRRFDGDKVNARWYGLIYGDNSTASMNQNVSAINAAIAYAKANSYLPVFVPAGKLYKNAVITLYQGVALICEPGGGLSGSGSRTIIYDDHSGNCLDAGDGVTVMDIYFRKTTANVGTGTGFNAGVEGDSRGQGKNEYIKGCRFRGYDISVYLNRWNNYVYDNFFDEDNISVLLAGPCNNNKLVGNHYSPGSSASKVGVKTTKLLAGDAYSGGATPNDILIAHGHFEPVWTGVLVEAGRNINIVDGNYFENTNQYFIDVAGLGESTDDDITVNVARNYFTDASANASTNSYAAVLCQAGSTTIDDNTINAYDSGTNTGLNSGIRVGSGIKDVLIGRNRINAYSKMSNINTYALRQLVRSRFTQDESILVQPSGTITDHYIMLNSKANRGLFNFTRFMVYCSDPVTSGTIGFFEIGRISGAGTLEQGYYADNFTPSVTSGSTSEPSDTEWQSTVNSLNTINDDEVIFVRLDHGSATNGRFNVLISIDIFNLDY